MELKCCFADCTSVRVSTFNRTAYGIEISKRDSTVFRIKFF